MRATWRSCARGSRRRRSCSPPPRPRSRRGSTPRADAIAGSCSRRGSARRRCPTSPPSISSARARRAAAGCRRARSPGSKRRGAGGEQALLFLNRRGYAPLTLCRACGHRFECPNCAAWLVEHRFRAALVCHHCGHVESAAETLPELPRGRHPHRLRAGRRAAGRGGGGSLSRHPHARPVVGLSRRDRDPARPARRWRRAAPTTSSSAPSWSPRATTSRC